MAKKLNVFYTMVFEALQKNEEFRKDDLLLIKEVYSQILGRDVSTLQFKTICTYIKTKKLPPFDTIRRARCKVQEEHPELIDIPTQLKRNKNIKKYVDFARGTSSTIEKNTKNAVKQTTKKKN